MPIFKFVVGQALPDNNNVKRILMSSLVGSFFAVILKTKSEESPYLATLRYAQSNEIGRKFRISNRTKRDFSCTFLHTFALTLLKIALILQLIRYTGFHNLIPKILNYQH